MSAWRHSLFVVVAVVPSLGASYRTANFAVEAPTPQIAKQVAEAAEKYRDAIARLWLGRAMPDWPEPCELHVDATYAERRGGYSTFYFDRGRVSRQEMIIKGPVHDLLPKVLPHELTHSIFAHYFGCPVPRWADEGSAVLSEDDAELDRRDRQMEQILSRADVAYPLDELFDLNDYPRDLRIFYAQSYSVTRYLVSRNGRERFLAFVAQGMRLGWDRAVRNLYGFESIDDLELAWRVNLRVAALRRQATRTVGPLLPAAQALCRDLTTATCDALRELEPVFAFATLPAGKDLPLVLARFGSQLPSGTSALAATSHAVHLPTK